MSTTSWNWPGARWWRCDLHVHTPESFDYTKRDEVGFADWAAGVVASGVQVVAVTDHNSGRGIADARTSLAGQLHLFPGVELTVSPGVHLLVLFDPSQSADDISALLAKVDIPVAEWGKREAVSPRSVIEAMAEAQKLGGLCILAHVDDRKGVIKEAVSSGSSTALGEATRRVLQSELVAALEVKREDPALLQYIDGTIPDYLPPTGPHTLVRSSDSHTPGDIGSRSTWIKMTTPNLEGLRLALQDGPLSVRDPAATPDPNQHANAVIESITIAGTRYIGRAQPFTLALNPWLNAIIGGRGTGKSSVLELTRAALRREGELPTALREDWDKLVRVYEARSAQGILTQDAKVTVIYRKDGARFRLQWDTAGALPAIEEEQADGSWVESPGVVTSRFPVRIYSQKQVYELTREPEALLRIVDEAAEVGFAQWKERHSNEEARFLSLRAQAREVEASLADEPRVQGELDDVKRKLAVFEGAGHAELLKRWQRRRRQGRALDEWSETLDGIASRLENAADSVAIGSLDATLFDASDTPDADLVARTEAVEAEVGALQAEVRDLATRAVALRDRWVADRAAAPWTESVRQVDEAYAQLIEDLRVAGAGDPSEYGRLVQQRQALERRLQGFVGIRENLATIGQQAGESLDRLRAIREEITSKRATFLERVLADNPFVRIEVLPFGSLAGASAELRGLLGRDDGAFAKDIGDEGEAGTLIGDLVGTYASDYDSADAAARPGVVADIAARLDTLKERIKAIGRGEQDANHRAFANFIQGRPPEQMDRLDAWFPGDSLRVSFQPSGGRRGFQPITQGSPGQRSAALLAFLLSHGDEPILLDQPEDDLDNQLVYDLIVQQLRQIKTRRQVVVVTHNANIVVNGDAEQVAALDVRNGQVAAVSSGGLQEEGVRATICQVMEGGAEAFRERYRRIAHGGRDVRLS